MVSVYHETTQNSLFDYLDSLTSVPLPLFEHKDSSCTCEGKCCTRCDKTQCIQFFYPNKNRGNRRSRCAICESEMGKLKWQNNKEAMQVTKKVYYDNHKEEILEKGREYHHEHKEIRLEQHRKWEQANPDKVKINNVKKGKNRRERIDACDTHYTQEEWEALKKQYENRCLRCGRNDVKLTTDHITPVSKGGSDDISNIQPLCMKCNSIKGQKSTDYR